MANADAIHREMTYVHWATRSCDVLGTDSRQHRLISVNYVNPHDINTCKFTCVCGAQWTGVQVDTVAAKNG